MIRTVAFFTCASLALILGGCPGETTGNSGGTTGAGGTGGGDVCPGPGGTCAPSFSAPAAGQPSASCKDDRELAGMPAGTVLRKACSPYHVKGVATAEGHVTIEAGVHVQLADDATFVVKDNTTAAPRSVDANGTSCEPVVFEPDSPSGRFGYVEIGSTAPGEGKGNSHLHYVEFHGGASKPASPGASQAVLFLTGQAPVLLDHVNVIDSQHFGLGFNNDAPLADGSNHVFVDKTPDGPAFVGTAPSMATLITLDVGCDPGPGIQLENGHVAATATWVTQPVPLLFRDTDLVVAPTSIPTVLTIAAPNTLLFGAMDRVSVGGNQGVPANLVAKGDITFDAIDPVAGWQGFFITTTADHGTVLNGGKIAHAGTVQPLGTTDGHKAYASVILNISNDQWPDISNETLADPHPAPSGAQNETACIVVNPVLAGTEPSYETQNIFTNCPVNVAHTK